MISKSAINGFEQGLEDQLESLDPAIKDALAAKVGNALGNKINRYKK